MFTGIVDHTGKILSSETRGDVRVVIACAFKDLVLGESVAVNGVCLTVVDISPLPLREGQGGGVVQNILQSNVWQPPPTQPSPSRGEGFSFSADVSAETLRCTAPVWEKGAAVNLERALKLGDSLSGHMVTGHVDGVVNIIDIKPSGDSHIWQLEAPAALSRYIAQKGSVTLSGVSLTVNKVEGARFFVNIIPHTAERTTLGTHKPGDILNLEIDLISRYTERLLSMPG